MQRFMSKRIDASGGENPPSTVPTIDDNGKVVAESGHHGQKKSGLSPPP